MIQVTVGELIPGMVLAKSIINDKGELQLAAGFEINEKVLKKLQSMELSFCWIYEEGTEHIIPEEVISEQVALQAQGAIKENLDLLQKAMAVQDKTLDSVTKSMEETSRFKNIIAADKIKASVSEIIDSLMGKEAAVVNLTSMRTKSGYLFQHALDVTVAVIMLGNRFKCNRFELEELALGAILMDIGMVVLPEEIVNKPGRLTYQEFTLLKEHTNYGYSILRENEKIPLTSAHVSYQHHERQDGGGYPRKLKGSNDLPLRGTRSGSGFIHRYAEISSVADTYMALISPRPHVVVPKTPEEAIRILITAAGTQLNRAVVDALVTMVPVYPVGSRVIITEDSKYNLVGCSGIVARCRPQAQDKPVIIILFDRDKRKLKPLTLDLMEEKEIQIQFVPLR